MRRAPTSKALRARPRRGLTLIELLVVLAILGALSTIAVRSLAPVQLRSRFEATQAVLSDVERALVGERDDRGGFVADLGVLPKLDEEPGRALFQLWTKPQDFSSSHLANDLSDPEVVLACGWRGPYLSLPPGTLKLYDGWGNPIFVEVTPTRWAIGSYGADGRPGGADYDADSLIVLRDEDPKEGIDRVSSEVAVTVTVEAWDDEPSSGSEGALSVSVFAYLPDPQTGGLRAVDSGPMALGTPPVPLTFEFTEAEGTSLTIGPRAFRAYVHPTLAADPRAASERRSPVLHCTLQPGAQNLELHVP